MCEFDMNVTHIPFQKTGFFSKMMLDYLEKNEKLTSFYNHFPDFEGFHHQILEKENHLIYKHEQFFTTN